MLEIEHIPVTERSKFGFSMQYSKRGDNNGDDIESKFMAKGLEKLDGNDLASIWKGVGSKGFGYYVVDVDDNTYRFYRDLDNASNVYADLSRYSYVMR